MAAPGILVPAVLAGKAGSGEFLAARPAVLREEVRAHPIDQRAKRCLTLPRP